ncbi:hypothetical protein [Planococcus salinarum]|uniref:hypothetical protein n=1 Tax=Planococcus salinarum TaxID=622695 RepID=UPI000E3BB064|nr:hypothetical protein [Planococcus salinarum]TAA72577.1 hypothetical protein D2909_05245 [Planococcus salinarum]
MNKFSYRSRILYFGLFAFFTLGFFLLQLYSILNNDLGTSAYVRLILWGLMLAFGIGGIFYTMAKNKKERGQ